jgi:hypothetical protein
MPIPLNVAMLKSDFIWVNTNVREKVNEK